VTVRRGGVRAIGLVVLVLGVLVGIVLWVVAGNRYDDAVSALAPVPIGCTTTLAFDRSGTYTFYVETKGEVGEIDGDCVTDDREYDVDEEDAPRVSLTLVDVQGDEVDLDAADGPSYDRAGHRGEGIRTVDIDEPGDYELTATSDAGATEVLVRVGRDPADGVTALRLASIASIAIGVVVGLLLLLVVGRRPPVTVPATPAGPRWPDGHDQAVPLAPPTANPPTAPPYTPRPPSHGPFAPPTSQPERQPQPRPPGGWPGRGGPLPPPAPPA
jgi:hypothetical protein